MMLVTASSNEDSQGTQLRIGKKMTAVCTGKRSRFSKPRPNLAISKRGESNVSVAADKISQSILNGDVKQEPLDIKQEPSNADIVTKPVEKDIETLSHENAKKVSERRDTEVLSQENPCKVEREIEDFSQESFNKKAVGENIKVLSNDVIIEKVVENDLEIVPFENSKKTASNKDSQFSSDEHFEKLAPDEVSQIISSTIPVIFDSEDIESFSDSNTKKVSPDKDIPVISNINVDNTSKENIPISPVKNSGLSSKTPESEKRATSNTTPTVIDKSKYPHLTSILSKKRSEPRKEAQQKRRRKFKKGDAPPERSKMTMADLIYWNPAKKDDSQKSAATVNEIPSVNIAAEEENVDDAVESENSILDSVPKLVISEDGTINIDQSSLFVSRNIPQPLSTEIVRKDDTTYSSFRKRPLTKHWTAKDTANFYRALSVVGADFSLMEQIFPNRTRRELKQKFKREEKFNIDIINKVLYESQTFDEITLNDFLDQNNTVDDPDSINEKEDAIKEKSRKERTSKKGKSTDNETLDSSIDHLQGEIAAENEKLQNKKRKKKKAKKSSDDEDVEIVIDCELNTNIDDTRKEGLKTRKRNAKKLPDDFVSIDSIEDFELLEDVVNDHDPENQEDSYNAEIENDADDVSSETANIILNKMMNGTDIQQNPEENCSTAMSLPIIIDEEEEYGSLEYIKNDVLDANVCMLGNVVAYEVVNTQMPAPKKRRRINSISPQKTRDYFLAATKVTPANYTNYTPVA